MRLGAAWPAGLRPGALLSPEGCPEVTCLRGPISEQLRVVWGLRTCRDGTAARRVCTRRLCPPCPLLVSALWRSTWKLILPRAKMLEYNNFLCNFREASILPSLHAEKVKLNGPVCPFLSGPKFSLGSSILYRVLFSKCPF